MPTARVEVPKPHGMHPSAVALVKHFEGLYLTAYRCPAGVPTIGYGHTAGVEMGDSVSQADAEIMLSRDLTEAAAQVDKLVKVPLTPEQRGALASFVFNLGAGSLKGSTLLKKLNRRDYEGAAREFGKWIYATVDGVKKALPGLVARRDAEAAMFRGEDWRTALKEQPMPQRVQASAVAKPLVSSGTLKTAMTGLAGAGGVVGLGSDVVGLGEVVQQVQEVKELRDVLSGLLPGNVTMAVVVFLLVAAMGGMAWHRIRMAREGV
ncbi:MAG TPA: lysozyme [Azospirillum sp.]|nr:lysozyme [Azospirillum sp.]